MVTKNQKGDTVKLLNNPMFVYLLAIVGIGGLVWGATLLVRGASSIARRLGISELIIGLTIVAIGTSLPEFTVTVVAALQGKTDLAIANIIGSNIGNILLILGVAALLTTLKVAKRTTWIEIPFALLAALVLGVMVSDSLIDGSVQQILSRSEGLLLLCFCGIFLAYALSVAKQGKPTESLEPTHSALWAMGSIVLGLICLTLGGKWLVNGAVELAQTLGASEHLIGITVIAIGTSLPELVTCAVAAKRGNVDIAVGNIVGSNILNIFLILGIGATITPFSFAGSSFDVLVMIGVSLVLFLSMFTRKKDELNRGHGIFFLTLYVAYLTFSIIKG